MTDDMFHSWIDLGDCTTVNIKETVEILDNEMLDMDDDTNDIGGKAQFSQQQLRPDDRLQLDPNSSNESRQEINKDILDRMVNMENLLDKSRINYLVHLIANELNPLRYRKKILIT